MSLTGGGDGALALQKSGRGAVVSVDRAMEVRQGRIGDRSRSRSRSRVAEWVRREQSLPDPDKVVNLPLGHWDPLRETWPLCGPRLDIPCWFERYASLLHGSHLCSRFVSYCADRATENWTDGIGIVKLVNVLQFGVTPLWSEHPFSVGVFAGGENMDLLTFALNFSCSDDFDEEVNKARLAMFGLFAVFPTDPFYGDLVIGW